MQVLNRRAATGVGVCATEVSTAKDSANPCYDEIKLKDTKKNIREKNNFAFEGIPNKKLNFLGKNNFFLEKKRKNL